MNPVSEFVIPPRRKRIRERTSPLYNAPWYKHVRGRSEMVFFRIALLWKRREDFQNLHRGGSFRVFSEHPDIARNKCAVWMVLQFGNTGREPFRFWQAVRISKGKNLSSCTFNPPVAGGIRTGAGLVQQLCRCQTGSLIAQFEVRRIIDTQNFSKLSRISLPT